MSKKAAWLLAYICVSIASYYIHRSLHMIPYYSIMERLRSEQTLLHTYQWEATMKGYDDIALGMSVCDDVILKVEREWANVYYYVED